VDEERRLFYVAMTRAKQELVLTSAADYGAGRTRKVSRFVVEALDLPTPRPIARKSQALEALHRHRPPAEAPPDTSPAIPAHQALRLSYGQIDDYETCPLKYRYVHVLRVPLLAHHAVAYGHAVHEAVRRLFEARLAGQPFTADDLVAAFQASWVSEGFLSRTHEEQRLLAGEAMLRRFFEAEARSPWSPVAVEREFAFVVDPAAEGSGPRPGPIRVQGRYDLVVEDAGAVTIVDFKTGDVHDPEAADKRAAESLQLDIYALAHLRTRGRLPDRVELRFLETGLVAGKTPTMEGAARTEDRIRVVAAAVRRGEFPARPTWMACGQCPFREICPHTARGPEGPA
jgi:DNA helicase-2/ATP-dependent DNA helicase PcrA